MVRLFLVTLTFFSLFFAGGFANEQVDDPLAEIEPSSEAFSTATQGYETTIFKTFASLLLLLGLVFITVWLLRRFSQGRLQSLHSSKSIKILEKRPLSPKSVLYLIDIHGKKLLLSESQCEVRALSTITNPSQKDL